MSVSATLWPIGTSIFDFSLNDELSWVTTHSMSVPFFSLDHDDADGVFPVVHKQLRNSHDPPGTAWKFFPYL